MLSASIWLAVTGSGCYFRSGHNEQWASTPILFQFNSLGYLKVEEWTVKMQRKSRCPCEHSSFPAPVCIVS